LIYNFVKDFLRIVKRLVMMNRVVSVFARNRKRSAVSKEQNTAVRRMYDLSNRASLLVHLYTLACGVSGEKSPQIKFPPIPLIRYINAIRTVLKPKQQNKD